MKDLPRQKKLVPISEAAKILGVSIDTVRRWDSEKKLHSQRPNGKNRYFAVEELEKKKFAQPFSISEAAKKLSISQSTLRRLENRGIIKPVRNRNGERLYTLDSLQNFLHSEYFLRKQEIAAEILEPLNEAGPESSNASAQKLGINKHDRISTEEAHQQTRSSETLHVLSSTVMDNRRRLLNLITFQRIVSLVVILISTTIFIIILLLTILFLLFPEDATIFLGYKSEDTLSSSEIFQKQSDRLANARILGANDNSNETILTDQSLPVKLLKPFGPVSLQVVRIIDEDAYNKIVPDRKVSTNINDFFVIDDEGNLVLKTTLTFPSSPSLKIDNKKASQNGEKGMVVLFGDNGTVNALRITSANLADGSVIGGLGGIVADGTIASYDIADNTILNKNIADGIITVNKLASDAVTGSKIKDGEVATADIADGAVTSSKISDNSISTTDLAAGLIFSDGDFLDLSSIIHDDASLQGLRLPNVSSSSPTNPTSGEGFLAYDTSGNQVIVYDGSAWALVGTGDITAVTAGNGLSGGGTSGSVSLSIALTSSGTVGSSSSNSGLEVNSGGLSLLKGCSDDEILKWTDAGGWACAADTGGAGSGISTIQENDSTVVSSATTIDFLGSDFDVSAAGSEGNLALDYTNSGITRKGQAETITGGWTFNSAATTFTTAIDVNTTSTIAGLTVDAGSLTLSGLSTDITTGPNELLTITPNGIGNVLINPSAGGQAALIVDKQGSNDIFSASSSGLTKFTISSSGDTAIAGNFSLTGGTILDSTDEVDINDALAVSGVLQVNGTSALGYSRFGTGTTGHSLSDANDLFITDSLEVDGTFFADGTFTAAGATTLASTLQLSSGSFNSCTALTTDGSGNVACSVSTVGSNWNVVNGTIQPKLASTLDLLIGGVSTASSKFAVLNVNSGTPTASISANSGNNATVLTGTGILSTTNRQTLTLGGGDTGNISIDAGGTGNISLLDSTDITGNLDVSGTLTSGTTNAFTVDATGNISTTGTTGLTFSSTGGVVLTGGTILDSTDEVDINDALAVSGVLQVNGTSALGYSRFGTGTTGHSLSDANDLFITDSLEVDGTFFADGTFTAAGATTLASTLQLSSGSFNSCTALTTDGSGNVACSVSTVGSNWNVVNGTIQPKLASTLDLLIGGVSTASSKFAVLNVNSGTPTASISANSGNNATVLTGTGILSTTNRQTLTLGGGDTGNISIDAGGTGNISLLDSTDITGNLDVSGTLTSGTTNAFTVDATGNISTTGTTGLTFSSTGGVVLTGGTILDSTDEVDINDALAVSGVLQVNGTSALGYSRFGTGTTGHSLSDANDLFITDSLEVDGTFFADGTFTAAGATTLASTLQLSSGSFNSCTALTTDGSGNVACSVSTVGSNWNVVNGTIQPKLASTLDLLIGGVSTASSKFAVLNVNSGTPTASISANSGNNATVLTGTGILSTTNRQTLTLGGGDTGNISIDAGGTGNISLLDSTDITGNLDVSGTLTSGTTNAFTVDATGNISTTGTTGLTFSSTGGVVLTGGTILDSTDEVDINDALAVSGVLQVNGTSALGYSRFGTGTTGHSLSDANDLFITDSLEVDGTFFADGTFTAAGATTLASTLQLSSGSFNSCTALTTDGSGNVACSVSTVGSNWNVVNGTIQPKLASTLDLLIGGVSTASSKFAVLNVNSGTPTASISANSGNNATVLTGTGILSTTNRQTLTLGGGDTGNISIDAGGTGNISLLDSTDITGNLDVSGTLTSGTTNAFTVDATGNISTTGTTGLTFSSTGGVVLTGGTILDSTDEVDINDALAVSGVLQVNGTSALGYSRFGTGTTGHSLSDANDLFITDSLEVDGTFFADGTFTAAGATTLASTLQLSSGSFNSCTALTTDGSGNVACSVSTVGSNWNVVNGTIQPKLASTLDLLIGGVSTASSKFAVLNVNSGTPTASISANSGNNATVLTGTGILSTTNRQTLTLGGGDTGNISIDAGGTGNISLLDSTDITGNLDVSGTLTSGTTNAFTVDATGNISTTGTTGLTFSSTGGVVLTGGTILDSTDEVDINDALAVSGVLQVNGTSALGYSRFGTGTTGHSLSDANDLFITDSLEVDGTFFADGTFTAAGATTLASTLQLSSGSFNSCTALTTDGSGNVACSVSTVGSNWNVVNGTIQPKLASTLDLLIGGVSTASSKFAVLNVNSGTPTASISANSGNNATVLTGTGILSTTNRQTLTLGNSSTYNTTGNTLINSNGVGSVGIGTTSLLSMFDVRGNSATTSIASFSGSTNFAGLVVDNRGNGDIFTASSSGLNRFVINQNGNVGIGTPSATEKLTLAGGSLLITNPVMKEMGAVADTGATELDGAHGVYVSGKYAYVVSQLDDGFNIIDISNPQAASVSGSIKDGVGATQLDGAGGVYVSGKYAYIASSTDGSLSIIDVSNPSAPKEVGTIKDGVGATQLAGAFGVYVSGKYAYVASLVDNSLSIIDVSDPTSPKEVGTIKDGVGATQLDGAYTVYVSGKYAYVTAQNDDAFSIFDVSNPSVPYQVSATKDAVGGTQLNGAQGIYVTGRYAYIAASVDDALSIFDITNPRSPVEVSTIVDNNLGGSATELNGAQGVYVSGKYAYVGSNNDDSLSIIDISTPSAPFEVSTLKDAVGATSLNAALAVHISGKYAYVIAQNDDALSIIDISGIDAPAANIGNLSSNDITVSENVDIGNNLYVRNGINVGEGGLMSNGAFVVNSASTGASMIQGAPIGQSLFILDYQGSTQNIFTASTSGTTKFNIGNNGDIQFAGNTNFLMTLTATGVGQNTTLAVPSTVSSSDTLCLLTLGNCSSGSSNWNVTSGTIQPKLASTLDLLIGGVSTASSKFAVLNVNSGTPTASVSSGLNGVGSYLTADGTLGTTNRQTLTLGNSSTYNTTGNTLINSNGVGSVGIGTTSLLSMFDVRGNSATTSIASFSGSTNFAGLVVDNRGNGDIFTASSSGLNRFVINQSGNVGIGTPSATEKLTLAGGSLLITNPVMKEMGAVADTGATELDGAFGIYVSGKYAYATALADDGVSILDISNPQAASVSGSITDNATTELDGAEGIYVSGKYAYVAALVDDGVEILDISNPSNPVHVGAITDNATTELDGARGIYVSGKYAYVTGSVDDGVEILDISNPANPVHVGAITDAGSTELDEASGIYVSGKYAYVASLTDGGVEILDVSNPANPVHVGAITDAGATELDGAFSIYVSGKYAYISSVIDDGVEILDISNPYNPTHVGSITDDATTELDAAQSIYVSGKYAYVAGNVDDGVEILDISNPYNPVHVGSITDNATTVLDGANGIYVSGKYAYVASGFDDGVEILDIAGIDAPAANIGNLSSNDITVTENVDIGNNLYVRNGINVGEGGLLSNGAFVVNSASTGASMIQGAPIGQSLFILDYQGSTQNIFTASSSGSTMFTIGNAGLVYIGGSTDATAEFKFDPTVSTATLYLGTDGVKNGGLTFYSSGTETDPTIAADANGNLIITAPTGEVQVGGGGDIIMTLTTSTENLEADRTFTASGAVTDNDFSFSRVVTGGGSPLSGALMYLSDTSSSTGLVNTDMLRINAALTSGTFAGNLLNASVSGVTKFRVDQNGGLSFAGDVSWTAATPTVTLTNGEVLTITTAAAGVDTLTFDTTNNYFQVGTSTDGLRFDTDTIDGTTNAMFRGTSRPTKKLTLNAEYPGATLTASGSGTITGSMTSDASPSAALSNWRTYYEWSSSETSLHDYTVAVRVKLPEDFSAWTTSSALTISYNTELATNDTAKMDVRIYNADTSLSSANQSTPVAYYQARTSATAKTWLDLTIDDSDLTDNGNALDAAGDIAVIYLKMYSKDNTHIQIGDITLSYLSAF